MTARVVVCRSAQPIPLSPARAARRGGLVVRSRRAAHETTLAGLEARPGARHLYGEVRCEAIERLQREALDSARPQVVVRVDRSGLNESHPLVRRLYARLERILRPIVDAEERRAGARLMRPGKEITARDEVGLRALNDALRAAFDAPGQVGFARGGPAQQPPIEEREPHATSAADVPAAAASATVLDTAMRFKQSPIRVHPVEQRGVSLLFDPARVPPGSPIEIATDPGLSFSLWRSQVPEPGSRGWSRVRGTLRAVVSAEPGSQLSVFAEAAEAEFEPETGIVTVYEGRREFKALDRAARQAGLSRARVREYVPYRMLEVEVAANAVYWWAAERILERRLPGERPADAAEYAAAVRIEAQLIRHRFHDKLMKGFLGPEVFEGTVSVSPRPARVGEQLRL